MTDLKQTLLDIASAIVDTPQEVAVISEDNGDTVNLTLSVAPDDMGMVIGRHGKIAKAIRTVMKAAANTCGKKVNVEIK
ncbi:MAG: KH domain-containing protein [Clostridia bacterium]|nr:KH domain-containing protein [Clostridia bacterium]